MVGAAKVTQKAQGMDYENMGKISSVLTPGESPLS